MVLEIRTDTEYECFEVVTKNQKFSGFPGANMTRWGSGYFVPIRKKHWYEDLEVIATWVNNNLKEENGTPEACFFTLG